MDEATKLIIAYAATLLGIPILAAKVLWYVPGAVSSRVLDPISRQLDEIAYEACEGFLALVLACFLFDHLGLPVVMKIPIILVMVHFVWEKELYQTVAFMLGAITGFLYYPRVFPVLAKLFIS
jgi:hypothetical protein